MSERAPLRVAFVVQGEGRGHVTQALAAAEMLRDAGHRIVGAFLGTSDRRPVPDFFRERLRAPVGTFRSPVLVSDDDDRGMSRLSTALHSLVELPRYAWSVVTLARELRRLDPDVVVNFFDLLGALALAGARPGVRRVAVAHHFLTEQDGFPRPEGSTLGWWGLRTLTRACGWGSHLRLALSFQPFDPPAPRTRISPPLLRRSVLDAVPEDGDHLQIYVLNSGYVEELERWHAGNREVPVVAYWDRAGAPDELELHPNLRVVRVDDRRFVEGLRRCRALATTAGFESVCEAMYLGKPVLMVPTAGHVEQECNALDALRAGAGIRRRRFDLDALLEHADRPPKIEEGFRSWVRAAPEHLLAAIEGRAPPALPASADVGA